MNILIDSYLYLCWFFLFVQEIQSLPLVKSTHECTQDISKQGILQSSVCEEHHVLRPFSRESSGAVTTTRQSLKYVNTVRTAHSIHLCLVYIRECFSPVEETGFPEQTKKTNINIDRNLSKYSY
jgi:hypothetical protein